MPLPRSGGEVNRSGGEGRGARRSLGLSPVEEGEGTREREREREEESGCDKEVEQKVEKGEAAERALDETGCLRVENKGARSVSLSLPLTRMLEEKEREERERERERKEERQRAMQGVCAKETGGQVVKVQAKTRGNGEENDLKTYPLGSITTPRRVRNADVTTSTGTQKQKNTQANTQRVMKKRLQNTNYPRHPSMSKKAEFQGHRP